MAISVTIEISVAGNKPFTDYHSVTIQQELFGHHSFQIAVPYEMLETNRNDGFFHEAHKQYCGQPVSIVIVPKRASDGAGELAFKGIITHIQLVNTADFTQHFVLSGFSPTYLLEDGTQRRTFIKQNLKQIFSEVLKPYSQSLVKYGTLQPQNQEPVKYTAQYNESNYVFLSRLADAYGEWFYYNGQSICLGRPATDEMLSFTVGGIQAFTMGIEVAPTRFSLHQYDYLAHAPYDGDSEQESLTQLNQFAATALQKSEALFSQPAHYLVPRHIRAQAQLNTTIKEWKAKHVSGLVTFQGNGENPGFGVGKVISVQGDITADGSLPPSYGHYRLTTVKHQVQDDQYENTFTALPESAANPAANPHVQVPLGAPELAEVIDVADPKHLGRIRVRFLWPVAQLTQAESGWLRVTTPYSGNGKGQLFTPEPGSQVLVAYEQNQAEFPVVVGNLFHAQNPQNAQYTTPENQLKGLQTAGGNKLVLADKAGEQKILLSNSNNKTTAIEINFKDDGSIHIQSSGPVTVNGSIITLEAGKEGAINLHAKTIAIEAEQQVQITSKAASVTLKAQQDVVAKATGSLQLSAREGTLATTQKMTLSGGLEADLKATLVKINS